MAVSKRGAENEGGNYVAMDSRVHFGRDGLRCVLLVWHRDLPPVWVDQVILWQGQSMIDGSPIMVVGTEHSANRKTGPLWQTWILRSDMHPFDAVQSGADKTICGDCPMSAGRGCYVAIGNAPTSIWRKFVRGGYRVADAAMRKGWAIGARVRVGAYGDPAAVPEPIWREILEGTRGHTGYSHQWNHPLPRVRQNARALRDVVMASVEKIEDAYRAHREGFRTFRVARSPIRVEGEVNCPASAEQGKKLSCAECMICEGAGRLRGLGVVIAAHGVKARRVECD